jgi:hypothetical protein
MIIIALAVVILGAAVAWMVWGMRPPPWPADEKRPPNRLAYYGDEWTNFAGDYRRWKRAMKDNETETRN